MKATQADAIVLLVHDGELADVAELLSQLQLATRECRGNPTLEDRQKPWELVIGTPPRLRDLGASAPGTRIAVVDEDSRTLRALLERVGVDYTVRRPVHPTALRLLLIHAVYRGPERRRTRRVHVGAPTRFRTGLRRHDAVLADLSMTGCRLLARMGLSRSRKLRIQVPQDPRGGGTFSIGGRVIRSGVAPDEGAGIQMIAVHFDRPSRRALRKLTAAIDRYEKGPATLGKAEMLASRRSDPPSAPASMPAAPAARLPSPPQTTAAPEALRANGSGNASGNPRGNGSAIGERRSAPRHDLGRRVIALGEEAAKVLLGRDISMGGMRVDVAPGLAVGDLLQLALHVRAREAPLVLRAEVTRDEGENGFALAFRELDAASRAYLESMVKFLPILASRDGDAGEGVIVSEILEHIDG